MAKIVKKLPKKPKKFIDSDLDGLSDWEEINIYGSDPYDEDTDDDGVDDGEEVLQGRNPATGKKFKDFFIPHEGNNYKPKSLHPKRVIFHVASVLLVKIVIIFFIIFYPLSAWMSPDLILEQGRKIITLTNQLRNSLNLKNLKENNHLNQAAYNKVQDMFLNQYFAHTSPDKKNLEFFLGQAGYNFAISGENLAMGFSDANELVEAWKSSPTHYSNLIDTDFSEIGASMAEGLFKEVDTVFTAQYFALPNEEIVPTKEVVKIDTPVKTSVKTDLNTKVVLSTKKDIEESSENIATSTNSIINTSVIIDQPAKQKEILVKVMADLAPETMVANAQVMDTNIELFKTASSSWEGQQIVYDKKIIVPASITTIDNNGVSQVAEIDTININPRSTSFAQKYFLLRNNPNNNIEKIIGISSVYFRVILIFAVISFLLNIFIQIKRQRPKLILSGLGIIMLLIILIIF